MPTQLGTFIAENHYLHAAELLDKSVKTIFGTDLLKVGALAELRQSLLEQRNVFHTIKIISTFNFYSSNHFCMRAVIPRGAYRKAS